MKKFVVFVLVALIALSCVFATDGYKAPETKTASNGTAQINITTSIKEEWPKFQLATTSGVDANAVNAVNATDADFTAAVLTATDLADVADSTRSVGFAINQISDSRTKDNYVLTVTATDLVLVAKADGTAVQFTAEHTSDQKFTVVSGTPAVTAATGNTVINIAPSASANALTTHYNGKKVKTNSAIELGTFTVSWNTNTDAEAGDYEAHIILTVTSAV